MSHLVAVEGRWRGPHTFGSMGLFKSASLAATVNGQVFRCVVCQGGLFSSRSIKLNTAGMELFDLAWANKSSLGVICDNCGYVHEFLGDAIELWDAETGNRAS